jgi:UDP:flavonoid glycosyltransferase YjiC (YdhE family)
MAQFLPQALVLPQVDAVVCHAGSGTMLGALSEGKPIVALPMAADQFANAEQIVRTGAGVAVQPEVRTPEVIRRAIEQVLDTLGFAHAASGLQAEIAAMPSAEQRLAELVERAGVLAA